MGKEGFVILIEAALLPCPTMFPDYEGEAWRGYMIAPTLKGGGIGIKIGFLSCDTVAFPYNVKLFFVRSQYYKFTI